MSCLDPRQWAHCIQLPHCYSSLNITINIKVKVIAIFNIKTILDKDINIEIILKGQWAYCISPSLLFAPRRCLLKHSPRARSMPFCKKAKRIKSQTAKRFKIYFYVHVSTNKHIFRASFRTHGKQRGGAGCKMLGKCQGGAVLQVGHEQEEMRRL